jgi:hypothetical protein
MDYVLRLDIYPGYIADCQAKGIRKELRTTDYPIFTGLSQFKRLVSTSHDLKSGTLTFSLEEKFGPVGLHGGRKESSEQIDY